MPSFIVPRATSIKAGIQVKIHQYTSRGGSTVWLRAEWRKASHYNERKEYRVYNVLLFPTILHQSVAFTGHMTHINPTEHAQTTGSSHWACPGCQTLAFPVPNI